MFPYRRKDNHVIILSLKLIEIKIPLIFHPKRTLVTIFKKFQIKEAVDKVYCNQSSKELFPSIKVQNHHGLKTLHCQTTRQAT